MKRDEVKNGPREFAALASEVYQARCDLFALLDSEGAACFDRLVQAEQRFHAFFLAELDAANRELSELAELHRLGDHAELRARCKGGPPSCLD
jgi:hypothetical protein